MLATYMRRMRNNNLEIRIAGSSCRPQIRIIEQDSFVKIVVALSFFKPCRQSPLEALATLYVCMYACKYLYSG